MSERKIGAPASLGAPYSADGDLYSQIAKEFNVTRAEVKHFCFHMFYTMGAPNFESLVPQMRTQIQLALDMGLIERIK